MRKMTKIQCSHCQIEIEKPYSEVKRNAELGRRTFCSRTCCGKSNKNVTASSRKPRASWAKDKETVGISELFRRVRNRHKEKGTEYDVDLDYLRDLWRAQNGRCAYTNLPMTLPHYKEKSGMFTASLDRIDSSKGYLKENIQYVITPINLMKNSMSHEQTLELLTYLKL